MGSLYYFTHIVLDLFQALLSLFTQIFLTQVALYNINAQLTSRADDRQRVIYLMGKASSQLPNGRELGCLKHCRLRLFKFLVELSILDR
ncbi:hypothetical protein ES705_30351 [subsurface metagenome]